MRDTLDRLKEPSTWAAVAALLTALGVSVDVSQLVTTVGTAIAGLIAIILPERAR